jgi:hypothetical protein
MPSRTKTPYLPKINKQWWRGETEYREYAIVGVRWAFHSWFDSVTLAVLALRRGRVAARRISVREKLPHLDDGLAEAVDGIVQYIIETAKKEHWCLEDVAGQKHRFGIMFEIAPVPVGGYASRGETAENVVEKVTYFLAEKGNSPHDATKELWNAIKKS